MSPATKRIAFNHIAMMVAANHVRRARQLLGYCLHAQNHLVIEDNENTGTERVQLQNLHAFLFEFREAHLPHHRAQARETNDDDTPHRPETCEDATEPHSEAG